MWSSWRSTPAEADDARSDTDSDYSYDDDMYAQPTNMHTELIVGSEYMRRADYGRVLMIDANRQMASRGREEREERRKQRQQQRERFRQRGITLRGERAQTEAAIADSIHSIRQSAAQTGNTLRSRQEQLRKKRADERVKYEKHGQRLTEKYSTRGNQETVRALKAELAEDKMTKATEMRIALKKAKKDTDDDIMDVNTARVKRVYAETAHPVIRQSKTSVVAGRWDKADALRAQLAKLAEQREENHAAYLERAWAIKESTQSPIDCAIAAQERYEERVAYARAQTEWRHDILEQRKVVADGVRNSKKSQRDAINMGSLVLEEEVMSNLRTSSPRQGGEDALAMFSRWFGFSRVGTRGWGTPRTNEVTL